MLLVFNFPFFPISCYSTNSPAFQIFLSQTCLFPLPLFSPYAVGSHKDESDKQQHPDSDKDAGYQELGGRVLS